MTFLYLFFGLRNFRKHNPESPLTVIPVFNNPTYLLNMISQLEKKGLKDIVILDNDSNSESMTKALKIVAERYRVIFLKKNVGPRYIFESRLALRLFPEKFLYTDPDIVLNPRLPANFWETLFQAGEKYQLAKVGLALDISDRHLMKTSKFSIGQQKYTIWEWESQYWINRLQDESLPEAYIADIDTTFFAFNRKFYSRRDFYQAIRIAGNFTSKHEPWYALDGLSDEERAKYRSSQRWSSYLKSSD